ncbi:hypothetical protein [Spirosoma validum]|uniref:Uncharacterized protein n=1 Tax=Spirosoma validum TaxID=2771355 RepID=A0A927B1X3_9BACT|nr:hypothetical protein [Spirosoma validum]MBD2753732.1 hypothetical protein [Spirosoma validum]
MTDINNVHCETILDKNRQPIANKWEMKLTEVVAIGWQEHVFPYIEIEIMQGHSCPLLDGRTLFVFELDDEKSQALKQALFNVCMEQKMN